MKEQSHKDEMRAALRGDFERLRSRRDGPLTLEIAPEPEALPAQPGTPGRLDHVAHGEPARGPDAAERELAASPRSAWLQRLRGRR
ncbi:hypothetical protein Gocc_0707 [Gaiella occulta]|uniref:Uncharacterized protein n=1 Tax=Gaiella occulta TaxID=1002870 RepID=A0A7M2YY23_9ACTN|nr:hypothetical protein [Gaiella occulta]RDI74909.1 hypothetical protein Gocc_0707 [Gaiella occulta]